MLFHITYKLAPNKREDVQQKFKSTGAPAPAGVALKGRWHSVNGNMGFIIAESDDIEAVGTWIQEWSEMLRFEVMPVLTDEQIGRIIS